MRCVVEFFLLFIHKCFVVQYHFELCGPFLQRAGVAVQEQASQAVYYISVSSSKQDDVVPTSV